MTATVTQSLLGTDRLVSVPEAPVATSVREPGVRPL
jgi:hypothetical protein